MSIFTQLLHGVAYIKNAGFVHNDIKPENVLISFPYADNPQRPKATIVDFDLATPIKYRRDGKTVIPGSFLGGTLQYLPPETLMGISSDLTKKDVWGVGATIFLAITRRYIFGNGDIDHCKSIAHRVYHKGLPESLFTFTNDPADMEDMQPLVTALKVALVPNYTSRPSAEECLSTIGHTE
ncbi:kinase-like domain-containing protein [Syncephalis plumigaleata]|nr:kinase-like domain-containing protein [Syncephalis plumigaleata]